MFRTSSPNDGYSALENLLSKVNPHRATLFQYLKKNWEAADDHEVWYENHPIALHTVFAPAVLAAVKILVS